MAIIDNVMELKVDGSYYGGWTSASVTRSIEQIAGTFSLDATERWPGSALQRVLKPGQPCEVLIDGETVIDGYTDDVDPEFDKGNHTLRIVGRDRTGDLVDCSAIYKSGQWHNVKLETIARDLLKPFGMQVVVETSTGDAFPSWNIEEGESVFECLSHAAKMKALLVVSDAKGNLVITRAAKTLISDALVEGDNILTATGHFSWKDRYSDYLVKGQGKASDDWSGDAAAHPSAKTKDEVVSRYRPLVVVAEEHGNGASLKDRATWERNVRMGRSCRATITVQGWRRPSGALWQPNTMVPVYSPKLLIDAPLLIVGCTWRKDERGTVTQLAVARRESFDLLAGVSATKLGKKMFDKEEKERKKKGEDWSML